MSSVRAGDKLDQYQIDCLVARSGMASIFKATDTQDGKPVAIKIPHAELEADIQFWERFQREAKIGIAMEHPGVMKVYHDPKPGKFYMVLEWVDGKLLRNVLHEAEGKKLSQERAVQLALRILDALEYLHGRGVTHRDLKPENIMVDDQDRIKLIDFGIGSLEGSRRLTYTGITGVMGSPDYISPEQVKGKRGDKRSDLYSMGVIRYEMLTGKAPFGGPNALTIMNARLISGPVQPCEIEPAITPQLQEIVYRANGAGAGGTVSDGSRIRQSFAASGTSHRERTQGCGGAPGSAHTRWAPDRRLCVAGADSFWRYLVCYSGSRNSRMGLSLSVIESMTSSPLTQRKTRPARGWAFETCERSAAPGALR
jgi:serine/threonine protein kinase